MKEDSFELYGSSDYAKLHVHTPFAKLCVCS